MDAEKHEMPRLSLSSVIWASCGAFLSVSGLIYKTRITSAVPTGGADTAIW